MDEHGLVNYKPCAWVRGLPLFLETIHDAVLLLLLGHGIFARVTARHLLPAKG
jgi:hypothetical protein